MYTREQHEQLSNSGKDVDLDEYLLANNISVKFIEDDTSNHSEERFIATIYPNIKLDDLPNSEPGAYFRRGAVLVNREPFGIVKLAGRPLMLGIQNVRNSEGNYSVLEGGIYRISNKNTGNIVPGRIFDTLKPKKMKIDFLRFFNPANISEHLGEFSLNEVLEQACSEAYDSRVYR